MFSTGITVTLPKIKKILARLFLHYAFPAAVVIKIHNIVKQHSELFFSNANDFTA